MSGSPQHHQIQRCRNQLKQQLLQLGEPQIPLLPDLDKVVQKADDAENQRKHIDDQIGIISAANAAQCGENAHKGAADEHQSAHHRGALLAVVPGGTHLTDALTHMQCPQRRNQEPSSNRRKHKGYNTGNQALHISNPPFFLNGSSLLLLGATPESLGNLGSARLSHFVTFLPP